MLRFLVVPSRSAGPFFLPGRLVARLGFGASATFVQCGSRRFERHPCWRLRLCAKLNVLGFASRASETADRAMRI